MKYAKSKLFGLQNSNALLENENQEELKEMLKNSQHAVNGLIKHKNKIAEELQVRQHEYGEVTDVVAQLLSKKQKAEFCYQEMQCVHQRLNERNQKRDKEVREI
jgi:DNA repair ATPase RecN